MRCAHVHCGSTIRGGCYQLLVVYIMKLLETWVSRGKCTSTNPCITIWCGAFGVLNWREEKMSKIQGRNSTGFGDYVRNNKSSPDCLVPIALETN
jgi:hypothetical protein